MQVKMQTKTQTIILAKTQAQTLARIIQTIQTITTTKNEKKPRAEASF